MVGNVLPCVAMCCTVLIVVYHLACRRGSRVAPAPQDSASKVQAAVQARQQREAQLALERRALTHANASTSGRPACPLQYCRKACLLPNSAGLGPCLLQSALSSSHVLVFLTSKGLSTGEHGLYLPCTLYCNLAAANTLQTCSESKHAG